ncbi:MAG: LPS-assembly protein LptD [Caldimicrobium sp.]
MFKRILFLLGVLFFFQVWVSSHLYAIPKGRSIELSARKIELFRDGEKIIAQGDVILEQRDLLIYAEELVYEPQLEILEIKNFKLFDFLQNATILGDSAQIDLRNQELQGNKVFMNLKKEGFKIKAWGFSKNALNEYRAKRAILTTCEMDCDKEDFPPWSIEVRDLIITPEGFTSSEATTFRASKIPIAYIPKKMFIPKVSLPIFEPRKRGFLFPGITQGNRFGLGVQIPYFIPFTDQMDVTFAPLFTTKRGILYDLESQMALKEETKAVFKMRYLKDTKRSDYALTQAPKERYWITGKSDLIFSPHFDLHFDVDFLSDRDFLEEFNIGEGGFDRVKNFYIERFNRDIEDKSQDYRSSKFWLQYKKNSFFVRFQSSYLDYNGPLNKSEVLQPLVGIHLSLLPLNFKSILGGLNLDYDYFYREKGYYGGRTALNLELAYPFAFSVTKNEFKINVKNFYYTLQERENFAQENINRTFFESSFISYTLLSRNYRLGEGHRAFQFQHLLKPYIEFFVRSEPSQKEVPLFLYEDYLTDKKKRLEYGLWQFFSSRVQKNFLILRLYQQYDLNKTKRAVTATKAEERPFSDLFFQVLAMWKDKLALRYDTTYNFYGYGFKKHTFNLGLKDLFLESINFLYQEDSAYQTRQATLNLSHTLFDRLFINYYISRNLKKQETSEQKIEGLYGYDCYILGLGIAITPRDTKIYFRVVLKGLGAKELFKE